MQKSTLLLLLCLLLSSLSSANSNTAYVVRLHGEVDPAMARYVERGVSLAESQNARAIVVDIDTPGGRIDAALDISKALMRTNVPTVTLVTGQAWSAGALIALSTDKLYMQPGTAMGAAEPIPTTEKIVSAWRSALEGAAERNGRSPELAAAMVDRDVEVPGVIERGKLLSLSAQAAVRLGMSDGLLPNLAAIPQQIDSPSVLLIPIETNIAEGFLRVINRPVVSILLLTLGLAGIVIEVMTVGFGAAGVTGVVALALYFGGSLAAGQATGVVLLVFFLGLSLLIIEAAIPGFGIPGIAGMLAILVSLVMAAGDPVLGVRTLTIALVGSALLLVIAFRFLTRRKLLERFSLKERSTTERGFVAGKRDETLINAIGEARTTLRPAGIAEINGRRLQVETQGGFIPAGSAVRVVRVEGSLIVVVPHKHKEE